MLQGRTLDYLLYSILVIAPIYKDAPLAAFMGAAGETFLPALCYLFLLIQILRRKKFESHSLTKKLFFLDLWIFFVGFFAVFYWLFLGNPVDILGENLFLKNIKVFIQFSTYPIYLSLLFSYTKNLSFKQIFIPIIVTFLSLGVICIIETTQIPYAFKSIHSFGKFPYYRIRLLTREASWTSMLILNYCFLACYYALCARKKGLLIAIFICAAILLALTGAKSLMIGIILFFIFYSLVDLKNISMKNIWGSIVMIALGTIFIYIQGQSMTTAFLNDIENYTSFSTRTYTMLMGALVGLMYPMGIGGGLYLAIFPQFLRDHISIMRDNPFFPLNDSEIFALSYSETGHAVTAKSGLFQHNMYWGVIGTIIFIIAMKNIFTKLKKSSLEKKRLLMAALSTNFVLVSFSTQFNYEFWMLIAIILILPFKQRAFLL